ncbi:MAG: molybdopterin-dependent oxidoreductase, partial [Betaproteobacteria bacterium]|nr:molybdopterin-dependent oxidoreductase [Betaproteobacteria bacterium]
FVRDECIVYTNAKPDQVVLDIDQAVLKKQFFPGYTIRNDDNSSLQTPAFKNHSDWVGKKGRVSVGGVTCEIVNGSQHTGSQIHFYMETQSCVAIPGEGPEIVVHSSTQSANSVQSDIQQTLCIQANQVTVDVKRVGGAYGGKTTRSPFVAVPAALAAQKHRRPVRVAMPRDVDTWMIGDLHAFRGDFSFAIACEGEKKGRLLGAHTRFYSNGGNTLDCSFDVMDCAQLGADNAYNVPYFFTKGEVCRTNIHSNGAMRSYGGIQAMLIQEEALEAAAHSIGMLPEQVREMNFYANGDKTPFGQVLDYCYIREVWNRLKRRCEFDKRRREVQAFNAANRWRKRGISMIPLKYGLGYNLGFLMQGGALVDVYTADGSVLVQVGGVEMGQGILTKVAQVAAMELNIPLGLICMGTTQTNVAPDAIPTGATSGTDLSGGAVQSACRELRNNLEKLCLDLLKRHGEAWCRKSGINFWDYPEGWSAEILMPGATKKTLMWNNIVGPGNYGGLAMQNRVDLSAQALYSTPGLVNATDKQFYGFTFSAACSEVEIDVLTGETVVLRSDICYDMGNSINPAIDIGQIEGAFVMGLGYVMTEEVIFEPRGDSIGTNNTSNTWTYKPPASTTIPLELHVDLFPRDDATEPQNPNLLMGSKGVGEPPLVLAATVFFAIKHAVLAARQDQGHPEWFPMVSPATVARVQEACNEFH